MELESTCNDQTPVVDYSSTVIASIVDHLMGTQSTMITTSGVLSVTHLSPATEMLRKEMELRMFFLNYEYL